MWSSIYDWAERYVIEHWVLFTIALHFFSVHRILIFACVTWGENSFLFLISASFFFLFGIMYSTLRWKHWTFQYLYFLWVPFATHSLLLRLNFEIQFDFSVFHLNLPFVVLFFQWHFLWWCAFALFVRSNSHVFPTLCHSLLPTHSNWPVRVLWPSQVPPHYNTPNTWMLQVDSLLVE